MEEHQTGVKELIHASTWVDLKSRVLDVRGLKDKSVAMENKSMAATVREEMA